MDSIASELQGGKGFRPAVLPPGRELKSLDPVIKASRFGATMLLN